MFDSSAGEEEHKAIFGKDSRPCADLYLLKPKAYKQTAGIFLDNLNQRFERHQISTRTITVEISTEALDAKEISRG